MSVLVEFLDVSLVEVQERRICERSINYKSENLPLAVSIVIEESADGFVSNVLDLQTLDTHICWFVLCLLLNWLDEEYGDIVRF